MRSLLLLYSSLANFNVFTPNIAERFSKLVDSISGKGAGGTLSTSQHHDGQGNSGSGNFTGSFIRAGAVFVPAWGCSILRNGFRDQPKASLPLVRRCLEEKGLATGFMNAFEQGVVRGANDNGLPTVISLLLGAGAGAFGDPFTSSLPVACFPSLFVLGLLRNLGCVTAVSGMRFHQDDFMDRGIATGIYGGEKLGDIIGKLAIENNHTMPKLNSNFFKRIGGFVPCVMVYGLLVREGFKVIEPFIYRGLNRN